MTRTYGFPWKSATVWLLKIKEEYLHETCNKNVFRNRLLVQGKSALSHDQFRRTSDTGAVRRVLQRTRLFLSEHDYYTDLRTKLDRDDFITLPGLEASTYLISSENLSDLLDPETQKRGYCDMTFKELMELRTKGVGVRVKKAHHIHGILGTRQMPEPMFLPLTSFIRSVSILTTGTGKRPHRPYPTT